VAKFSVIYDACVLFRTLRDCYAVGFNDLFKARWTDQIHEEWIQALLRRINTTEILERTRELMDASVRDAKVSGYEELIEALVLPDPDDRMF